MTVTVKAVEAVVVCIGSQDFSRVEPSQSTVRLSPETSASKPGVDQSEEENHSTFTRAMFNLNLHYEKLSIGEHVELPQSSDPVDTGPICSSACLSATQDARGIRIRL